MPQLYLKEVEPFIVSPKRAKRTEEGGGDGSTNSSIEEQKVHSRRATKRNTSLVASDALLLCMELFQILAVLQAMSLKWIWPKAWIRATNFIFFFNMDVWEFTKVNSGAFIGARKYDTPSDTVGTKFYYILTGWAAFFCLLQLLWAAIRIALHVRKPAYLLVHVARLQRAVIIILQLTALPFGVSAFKVFHCTSDGQMSVDNSVECWSGMHWAYVVPVVVGAVVVMGVFPAWLAWRIRHEAMGATQRHHEDFLKLKEVEYMSGLDVVWIVHAFHLFSSFRLRAIYFRPVFHLFKLLMLIVYAATFQNISAQAISMMVLLLLVALLTLALRPFRLAVFNVAMVVSYFCLAGDALFGTVLTQFDPTQVLSPWLVEPYSVAVLVALNGVLLLGTVLLFLIFLLAYRLCCQGRCTLSPLWPVMTAYEYQVEGAETPKYLAAVLRGRALIERCRRLPAMFVPVHELSQQIHVLNAYMRESEMMQDGLHPTLWAVLDETIDMYQRLEPKSLFGEMVQDSIRKNAAHFMTLMPVFAHRLAQREYDLILMSPLKKRLLLKMYIIAMWMEGSRRRKTHHELTQRVLNSIWEESPEVAIVSEEREYREFLHPDAIQGPETEALYMTGTLDLGRGFYDLEAVEEEEESLSSFLKRAAPPTLVLMEEELSPGYEGGADNPAFIADDSSEAPPDVLVDLEALAGANNRPQDGETNAVTLTDYREEESSTDVPSPQVGVEEHQELPHDSTPKRHDTGTSVVSSKSRSSAKSSATSVGSESSAAKSPAAKSSGAEGNSTSSGKQQQTRPSPKSTRGKGGKAPQRKKAGKTKI